ncbi:MAG: hypothetical protein ACREM2_12405 [Vulcanimicrobiaceae bacterium]
MHESKPARALPEPLRPAVEQVAREIATANRESTETQFLFASVADIQGTIRAIDTKVSILLAALAIPLPLVRERFAAWHAHPFAWSAPDVLAALAIVVYGLAALAALRTLGGIGNAGRNIEGARHANAFYAGGLFRWSWPDLFVSRSGVRSNRSLAEFVKGLPASTEDVVLDLASEVMTLAYIRDLKLYRQRGTLSLTVAALALGLLASLG